MTNKPFVMRFALFLVLIGGIFGMWTVKSVSAATLIVTNTNDTGPGSLRQAIMDAVPGDTIVFDSGLAGQTITLNSTLVLDKDLTIDGSALVSQISISGNYTDRIFVVNPGVVAALNMLFIVNGGGIYNQGALTVVNSVFAGHNLSSSGAAINNDQGSLTVTGSRFTGNTAKYDGGAIHSTLGTLVITDTVFDNNDASGGGAIACSGGTMTVTNNLFFTNTAHGWSGGAYGGAIYNLCNSTITNSTFSANVASLGGAVLTDNDVDPLVVTNSTFHANTAPTGGGIYNAGQAVVTNSTFSDNNSSDAGAIRNALGGVLSLRNSILANTVGGVDCSTSDGAAVAENTHNLIETTAPDLQSCGPALVTGDPLLGPLSNNGSFSQTMALLPGSPAIDAGAAAFCPVTDQRGVSRPLGIACDLGAYEYEASYILPGETVRVSVDSNGAQANNGSHVSSISADGRYVVFESYASNLAAGDTNNTLDVFVHDLQTGLTRRVSLDSNGGQGYDQSDSASLSATGRYIAFRSSATNLVPGDTNGMSDIFVHDVLTGSTRRISLDSNGVQGNADSYFPAISADGETVAFMSSASNLVQGDTNGMQDIFVHDLQTGITRRVSADSNGVQANSSSIVPSISGDGQYIVFDSSATNLVPGDTNGQDDIFIHDRQTGTTRRVSVDSNAGQADGASHDVSISADGRYVAYFSEATNLVPGDTNAATDVFVYDLQTGTTTRVSVDSNGAQANNGSEITSISADGRYIAFRSRATNLVAGDTNAITDVFVHDLQTGMTTRASVASNGTQGNGWSDVPSLSADGRYIAFVSEATNLVPGDTNLQRDIFVHRQNLSTTPPTPTPTFTSTFTPTNTSTPTATPSYSYKPLYLSLSGNQTVGGVASADEDILFFDGMNWSLFFDGSDVGVGGSDLFAFSIVDADTILMSFATNVTVNGIAATSQDVLRFDAAFLGSGTSGTWSLFFDGSDVGLADATNEKIDAVTLLPDGRLLLSTNGNPSVPGLTGRDEDVLAFTPTSHGDVTSGTWSMYFDGSDVGLSETSGEDIDAFDLVGENVYLSTQGDFSAPGLAGADEDVFVCAAGSVGEITACDYSSSLYFDGSTWGLAANDVDAFHYFASGLPPTAVPTDTATSTPTSTRTPTPTATSVFTSTPSPSLFVQIVQPNGGEVLAVGTTYRITWNSTPDVDTVSIGYKACDSCLVWIVTNIPNAGYFDWNVFVGNPGDTQFKIFIIGYDTGVGSNTDVSDHYFTVLQPPTATPTNSTFTFTPAADAYINAGSPTTNYGSSTSLRLDASPDLRSYLRFEVQGLSGSVTKVTLRMYANSSSSLGYTVRAATDSSWSESTINYNNPPAYSGTLGSSGAFGANAWTETDMTGYIIGNGTYSLVLTTASSTAISLASRETGANAPQLIFETAP